SSDLGPTTTPSKVWTPDQRRTAPRCAASGARSRPFVKDQKRADSDQQKTQRVIPRQRLLQIQDREAGKPHQRDHFLHGLELRRRIHRCPSDWPVPPASIRRTRCPSSPR